MKLPRPTFLLAGSGIAIALLTLGMAGCSSANSPFERSSPRDEVAASVDDSAAQVAEVRGRINDAVRELDDLVNHSATDLRRQYDDYHAALDRLQESMTKMREQTDALERKGREYLEAWDREIATLHSDGLRRRTSERRDEVAQRMDDLHDSYLEAREKLAPLARRLNDADAALKIDMTPAGVRAVQPFAGSVRETIDPAQQALDELGNALRRAAVALAPENAPGTPATTQ